MAGDEVTRNLQGMDELDFNGWNRADWHGAFAHSHTDDVVVEVKGQPTTRGIQEHIEAGGGLGGAPRGTPIQVASPPTSFGPGGGACGGGEVEGGGRGGNIAKRRD